MEKVKTILGYTWAILGIPVIVAMFFGTDVWVQQVFVKTGFHVSARWSGGEVVKTIPHEQHYQTDIHRPVFDGFLWEKNQGFVQIDWKSTQGLPESIEEEIDFDQDGSNDFQIILNTQTNEATLTPFDSRIISIAEEWGVLVFENARTVRVALRRSSK
jgi:hypothetical protein